jgi:hypothetical protein
MNFFKLQDLHNIIVNIIYVSMLMVGFPFYVVKLISQNTVQNKTYFHLARILPVLTEQKTCTILFRIITQKKHVTITKQS